VRVYPHPSLRKEVSTLSVRSGWIPVLRRHARQRRSSADSGRSGARGLTSQIDPEEPFPPTPADRRGRRGAVIRTGLLETPMAGSPQLVEQRLRLFQIGSVEAFGEPAVDRREAITGFGSAILVTLEPGEAHRCAQFP